MILNANDGIYLDVHVQPKSRRPGIRGIHGGRLKIAVTEPPESGRANEAAVETVANLLGVASRSVIVATGATSRRKRLYIEGLDVAEARRLISVALEPEGGSSSR